MEYLLATFSRFASNKNQNLDIIVTALLVKKIIKCKQFYKINNLVCHCPFSLIIIN